MCTRFKYGEEKDIYTEFDLLERKLLLKHPEAMFKVGEVYPSEKVIALIKGRAKCDVAIKSFGYKVKNGLLLNAREETIEKKYLFNEDFQYRRGAILVNGFYEWDKQKNKYYFYKEKQTLYLAIIYNRQNEFAILTTNAGKSMEVIHDRQPVILNKDEVKDYIDNLTLAKKIIATSHHEFSKILVNYK